VVLSSCTTEEAGSRFADDPDSLVGAFLRAGVSHVVASRWNVDSKFIREHVRDFYPHVFGGSGVSSLRLAAEGFLGSETYSHPYYWASLANFDRALG
jgi:CHAT domain-containing protein